MRNPPRQEVQSIHRNTLRAMRFIIVTGISMLLFVTTTISDTLKRVEDLSPVQGLDGGTGIVTPLSHTFMSPSTNRDLVSVQHLPPGLVDFWRMTDGVRLFEDTQFGQWGLIIYSIQATLKKTADYFFQREGDYEKGDLIFGEFLGDCDLLLIRADVDNKDFGEIRVVSPLDGRSAWDNVGSDLATFLDRFIQERGAKFWEPS